MKPAINALHAEAAPDLPPLSPAVDEDGGAVSLDDPCWDAELLRRVTEIRNGTAETFDADEVMAEAKRRFG